MCETLREILPKLLGERDNGDGNTNAPPLRPDKIHPRGRRGPSGSIGIFSKIGIGQFGRGSNSCGILSPSLGLFYYLECCRPTREHDGLSLLPLPCGKPECLSASADAAFLIGQVQTLPVTAEQFETATRQDSWPPRYVSYEIRSAHLCSHATAKGGMLFLGPNRVVSGL